MNADELNNVDDDEEGMGTEPEPGMPIWVIWAILGAMIFLGLVAVASQSA